MDSLTALRYVCGSSYRFENERKIIKKDLEKLGKLKKFEGEMGVDLSIALKAARNGFYIKVQDEIIHVLVGDLTSVDVGGKKSCWILSFHSLVPPSYVDLKDYGKTWALTKRELEEKQ